MLHCPNCSAEVDSADKFCRACGARLSRADAPMRSETVKQLIHDYRQQLG